MHRFVSEALADQFVMDGWVALAEHAARCEALPEFADAYQPFRLTLPD